jgi:putative salt-induced outer membrane protein YdiY
MAGYVRLGFARKDRPTDEADCRACCCAHRDPLAPHWACATNSTAAALDFSLAAHVEVQWGMATVRARNTLRTRRSMRRRLLGSLGRSALPALALLLFAEPRAAWADVVRMKSGDVVTGKIESVSDEELIIDPDFADAFDIKLKYIASIQTTRPVKVTFKDGRERTGFVELDTDGKMQVRLEPSRWEAKHEYKASKLLGGVAPQPPAGTKEPLADLATIQELEVAYYRYDADLEVGFSAASGNTNSSAFDLSGSLEPAWGPNSLEFSGKLSRQTSNDSLTAENWSVLVQYERDLPKKWYAATFGTVERDPFQDLDLRSALAIGLGYRFFDMNPTHLSVSLGPAYVRENFSVPGADRRYPAVVWTFDFERDFFGDDLTLYHAHHLIQSLSGSELILKTTQGIKIDLWDDLDLKLEFDYDHTSEPAPGITEKDDLRYLLKFDLEFEGDEADWLH